MSWECHKAVIFILLDFGMNFTIRVQFLHLVLVSKASVFKIARVS